MTVNAVQMSKNHIEMITESKVVFLQAVLGVALTVIGAIGLYHLTPALSFSTAQAVTYIASGALLLLMIPISLKAFEKGFKAIKVTKEALAQKEDPIDVELNAKIALDNLHYRKKMALLATLIPVALAIIGALGFARILPMPNAVAAVNMGLGLLAFAWMVKHHMDLNDTQEKVVELEKEILQRAVKAEEDRQASDDLRKKVKSAAITGAGILLQKALSWLV